MAADVRGVVAPATGGTAAREETWRTWRTDLPHREGGAVGAGRSTASPPTTPPRR